MNDKDDCLNFKIPKQQRKYLDNLNKEVKRWEKLKLFIQERLTLCDVASDDEVALIFDKMEELEKEEIPAFMVDPSDEAIERLIDCSRTIESQKEEISRLQDALTGKGGKEEDKNGGVGEGCAGLTR